nr:DinB family protein [Allocatelliglobosispora scoriae]
MLVAFLDYQRATLELKCAGLTDDQLRELSTPPSQISLLGLLRHMADVETWWFGIRFAKLDLPSIFDPLEVNADFEELDSMPPAEVLAVFRANCARSREIVAAAASLEDLGMRGDGSPASLRWIILHMIEEYARHNGHADLVRERVDGATGA